MQPGWSFSTAFYCTILFLKTAYTFLGFIQVDGAFYAVLKQPFISSDAQVEMEDIKALLHFNGFENNKRHDYIHQELGLILEDMHDETVK